MSKEEPMSQLTRLTGLAFTETSPSVLRALYLPRLTQEQVIDIPVTEELKGAVVFNTDTEEIETYTAAGFWLPILTAESDINVDNITAETADLYSIQSHDITNSQLITTLGLLVQGDAQINDDLVINNNLQVLNGTSNFKEVGVTEDLGVNGALTAGTAGVLGNFGVNGDTELQNTVITGNLEVTGICLLDAVSATTIDVNDFEALTNRVNSLLYGLTAVGGDSLIVGTLDTGAGTGATISIKGSNLGGTITINTGSAPAAAAIIATFTLPVGLNPLMDGIGTMITKAGNVNAAIYEAATGTYINAGTGNVIAFMASGVIALTASTTYVWNYIIAGNKLGS